MTALLDDVPEPASDRAFLEVRDLDVHYSSKGRTVRANDRISLDVPRGSTYALIGESGCGKSSFGKAICGLVPVTGGSVVLGGDRLGQGRHAARDAGRLGVQIVLQDPTASLDPRWPIWRSVAESRRLAGESKADARDRAVAALAEVGIAEAMADRRPSALSGGQKQRVTIARAIAAEPRLIVLDEAVSALDVSVRNEVLQLLDDLKHRHDLTYVFISHDMSVVTQSASHVAVMYLGKIVESGTTAQVVQDPVHPYTRALLSAVPTLNDDLGSRLRMVGEFPDPANPPKGCRFHTRCPFAQDVCTSQEPSLDGRAGGRRAACHFADELAAGVERRTRSDPAEAGHTNRSIHSQTRGNT